MKIFNIVFVIIFVLFAALQYNDPDPYLWIPIYLYGAFCCWLIFKEKYYATFCLIGIIVFAGYAAYLFFVDDGVLDWLTEHNRENIAGSMKAEKPWIEATREFLGLGILVVVLTIDYFYALRRFRKIVNSI